MSEEKKIMNTEITDEELEQVSGGVLFIGEDVNQEEYSIHSGVDGCPNFVDIDGQCRRRICENCKYAVLAFVYSHKNGFCQEKIICEHDKTPGYYASILPEAPKGYKK